MKRWSIQGLSAFLVVLDVSFSCLGEAGAVSAKDKGALMLFSEAPEEDAGVGAEVPPLDSEASPAAPPAGDTAGGGLDRLVPILRHTLSLSLAGAGILGLTIAPFDGMIASSVKGWELAAA